MVKYELHSNGERQDKRQFKTPLEANQYIQQLKDILFKRRNDNPKEYRKNLALINSLEIIPVEVSRSSDVYSIVEITDNGCSTVRNYDNIEQAEEQKIRLEQNTNRIFEIMETIIRGS